MKGVSVIVNAQTVKTLWGGCFYCNCCGTSRALPLYCHSAALVAGFPLRVTRHAGLSLRRWLLQHRQRRRVLRHPRKPGIVTAAALRRVRAEFAARLLQSFWRNRSTGLRTTGGRSVPPLIGQRPRAYPVITALLSLWASATVVSSLMEGFHAAYRLTVRRPFCAKPSSPFCWLFFALSPCSGQWCWSCSAIRRSARC